MVATEGGDILISISPDFETAKKPYGFVRGTYHRDDVGLDDRGEGYQVQVKREIELRFWKKARALVN